MGFSVHLACAIFNCVAEELCKIFNLIGCSCLCWSFFAQSERFAWFEGQMHSTDVSCTRYTYLPSQYMEHPGIMA